MSTTTLTADVPTTRSTTTAQRRFTWIMTALAVYFVGGLYLDGWAHTHGQVDQSFFTPWHAVLYSGQLLMVIFLLATLVRNVWRGATLRAALPRGYNLSLLGVLLWFIGGPGDLIWHTLFGIEQNVAALYSPTHLLLALGITLAVSGPVRAALSRSELGVRRLRDQLPLIFSLTCTLSVLTFFIMIAHPLSNLWATRQGADEALGMIGIMLDTALLMGCLLFSLRHGPLAPGALTIILGANAVVMGFLYRGAYPLAPVLARVLAGGLADVLYQWLNPTTARPNAWRLFAFGVPIIVYALYFLAVQLTSGLVWTTHLWAGAIVIAGAIGVLLSFLSTPEITFQPEQQHP